MEWLLKIMALLPLIAAGIEHVHAEKSVETKTQLALDEVQPAIQAATALVPAAEAPLAQALGSIAQSTLASTVAAFHTAGTPATVQVGS